ncbi:helix-turn-helix domain-containing protein [Desemzia incerta]|uniref:helix-turn-helix domain-containing protein n=1 Tax=Desemzia incerta TaxID=82801 RepID=UPI003D07905F
MSNDENFGSYLKKLRKENNKTTRELGELAGISNASISQFENGKRKPSPQVVKNLARSLSNYNLIEERKIYMRFLELLDYKEEIERANNYNSYIDDIEFEVALSQLIPLDDGVTNGFSLNGDPIESHEQKVLNAFIESMKATREKQMDFYRQGVEQGKKEIHDNP